MKAYPYKFLVNFIKNDKVIELEFCNTLAEIKVLQAIAHSKGCLCEAHKLYEEKPVCVNEQYAKQETTVARPRWERCCKCIETGKVYTSVSDCSRDTGISYKAIINALRCGSPRNGLHFAYVTDENVIGRKVSRKQKTSAGYYCTTTMESFDSVRDVLQRHNISRTTFYRAMKLGKPVKGLLFHKA